MSGNKNIYVDAMKKASNAAWDKKWDRAISEYKRALAEFPEDSAAHAGLAVSLQESDKPEQALHEYLVTAKLQPRDPAPLARAAMLLEKMGRRSEAAANFLTIAEMFADQKQMNKAVEAWRRASLLQPEQPEIREQLANAYREAGHDSAAAKELAVLAKIYQRQGDVARAQTAAAQALTLDPANTQAKALSVELSGRASTHQATQMDNPLEQARRSSLSRLAESILDEGSRSRRPTDALTASRGPDAESLVARAIGAQTRGDVEGAITAYEEALAAGATRPEVKFNLALLYQQSLRYDNAIARFKETAAHPEFALASYFALGQSYRAQGKNDAALENLVQAMKVIDLSTVKLEGADEVIRLYESLAEGYRARGAEEQAETFTQTLLEFLSSKGWEDKVREVRRHLASISDSGTPLSLAEVMEVPHAERVIEALSLSETYVKEGRLRAAGDEAYRAIEYAPNYLPAHVRLAEIFVQAGRSQEAREKYDTLAETAAVRGDIPKALSFYRHAIQLSPNDIKQRSKLIDLLTGNGQIADALNEYLELGAALEHLGQTQTAIDKYGEAQRLAQRAGVVGRVNVELRDRLARAYFQARDWTNALPLYEQLEKESPNDQEVKMRLVELYRQTGQRERSEAGMQALLKHNGDSPDETRDLLQQLLRDAPNDVDLNLQLARHYASEGQSEKAVELLDQLGERLLMVEQREDAVAVIEEIVRLNPAQVDGYRQLLEQLRGSS